VNSNISLFYCVFVVGSECMVMEKKFFSKNIKYTIFYYFNFFEAHINTHIFFLFKRKTYFSFSLNNNSRRRKKNENYSLQVMHTFISLYIRIYLKHTQKYACEYECA